MRAETRTCSVPVLNLLISLAAGDLVSFRGEFMGDVLCTLLRVVIKLTSSESSVLGRKYVAVPSILEVDVSSRHVIESVSVLVFSNNTARLFTPLSISRALAVPLE